MQGLQTQPGGHLHEKNVETIGFSHRCYHHCRNGMGRQLGILWHGLQLDCHRHGGGPGGLQSGWYRFAVLPGRTASTSSRLWSMMGWTAASSGRMKTIRENVVSSIVTGRSKVKVPVFEGIVHDGLEIVEIGGRFSAGRPSGTDGANYTKTPPRCNGENVPKWWTPGNMCQSVCYMWLVGGAAMPEIWKGIYVNAER